MIKYDIKTLGSPMTENQLADEWKKGNELINVVKNPAGQYVHYFKYTGGIRAHRASVGRGY